MLGTKHTNLTLITLTGYDHMVNVVKLHAVYFLLAVIFVCYCKCLLKLKDNTIITTLQAFSKTIG